MTLRPGLSYSLFLKQLDVAAAWARRTFRVLLIAALLFMIFAPTAPALAQDSGPDDSVNGTAAKVVGILANLGKLFIQIAYGLMVLAFAVGSVKNGLSAQLASNSAPRGVCPWSR